MLKLACSKETGLFASKFHRNYDPINLHKLCSQPMRTKMNLYDSHIQYMMDVYVVHVWYHPSNIYTFFRYGLMIIINICTTTQQKSSYNTLCLVWVPHLEYSVSIP